MLINSRDSHARNILWYSAGMTFYFVLQWMLTVAVVRLSGFRDAGILAVSMASTNIFYSIGLFGIRQFQVSDYLKKFNNSTYISSRLLTSLLVIVGCFMFTIIKKYETYQIVCINIYMLFRASECIVDVYHGIDQVNSRYDKIGKSFIYRGLGFFSAFCILLFLTHDLIIALAGMAIVSFTLTILFDIRLTGKSTNVSIRFEMNDVIHLLKIATPLMINTVLATIFAFIPKNALEVTKGSTQLGIYSSITSPTLFIQVFISYLYAPFIPIFAEYYHKNETKKINQLVLRFALIIGSVGLLAILALKLAGKQLLIIVFGVESGDYAYLLSPAVLSTIATSLTWFFFALLTAVRKINSLLIGSVLALILSIVLSPILISRLGMNGVSYTYLFAQIAQIAVMATVYVYLVHQMKMQISK